MELLNLVEGENAYRIQKCVRCGGTEGLYYLKFLVEPGKEAGRDLCVKCGGTDGLYHTNRCVSCGRVVTKLEIARSNLSRPFVAACPCGSRRTRPANLRALRIRIPGSGIPRTLWLMLRRALLGRVATAEELAAAGVSVPYWHEQFFPRLVWLTVLYWLGLVPPAPVFDPAPVQLPPLPSFPATPPVMRGADDDDADGLSFADLSTQEGGENADHPEDIPGEDAHDEDQDGGFIR